VKLSLRYGFKQIMIMVLWIILAGVTVFLLAAAIKSKPGHACKAVEISIHGVSNNFFVDKQDILNTIETFEHAKPVGKAIGSFDLRRMELELEKNVWIKSAEMFFDNNEVLQVVVQEREPVARVFTTAGTAFYIDEELAILPLSDKFSARLPVFTGFPSDKKVLSKADSNLLADIKTISLGLQQDSFSMAMIEQVDISPARIFEMIPKIGNQVIVFGDGTDTETKLDKLKLFYREVMAKSGWNKYSVINVQYKNQVVAKRRGAEDIAADSLRTLQLMQVIADRARKAAEDSLQTIKPDTKGNTVDSSMIQQSIQRDEGIEAAVIDIAPVSATPDNKTPVAVTENPVAVKQSKVVKPQPNTTVPKKNTQQPKAAMPKKNEY
jgi:cell division protein FtsQ